jgi:hypothetical protein
LRLLRVIEALWYLREQDGVAMAEGSIETCGERAKAAMWPQKLRQDIIGQHEKGSEDVTFLQHSCTPSSSPIPSHPYTDVFSRTHAPSTCIMFAKLKRSSDPLSPCFRPSSAGKVRGSSASVRSAFRLCERWVSLFAGKYTLVSIDSTLKPARALPEASRHDLTPHCGLE